MSKILQRKHSKILIWQIVGHMAQLINQVVFYNKLLYFLREQSEKDIAIIANILL